MCARRSRSFRSSDISRSCSIRLVCSRMSMACSALVRGSRSKLEAPPTGGGGRRSIRPTSVAATSAWYSCASRSGVVGLIWGRSSSFSLCRHSAWCTPLSRLGSLTPSAKAGAGGGDTNLYCRCFGRRAYRTNVCCLGRHGSTWSGMAPPPIPLTPPPSGALVHGASKWNAPVWLSRYPVALKILLGSGKPSWKRLKTSRRRRKSVRCSLSGDDPRAPPCACASALMA
mmetsp:Transcript_30065/g.65724  ORF Transcript_30065/g.65724 Transcript_30065/m.65724 type:complete len:228 (-) Transcript_30065:1084-1767(-)